MSWTAHVEWDVTRYVQVPGRRRSENRGRSGEARFEAPTHKQAIDKATKHIKKLTLQGSTNMSYSVCVDRKDSME